LIFLPSFLFVPPSDLQEGAPIIYGWDCFLLNIQEKPSDWKTGPNVLALTGGSDVSTLGKTWPSRLDKKLPLSTELHWVNGPFANRPCLPQLPRIQIKNHIAPAGLGLLMSTSNYAVTVFGVSFFELLYLGIPTVVFSPYESKDQLELKEISKLGLALVAENEIEATELLLELMNDESLARRLSLRSRAILSNSGANRLCLELANLN
jgi:spore coat polysaccharide biosynthesis predicted glycosyltransferase SpsG